MRTQHGSEAKSFLHVGQGTLSQCHELLLWWGCPVLPMLLGDSPLSILLQTLRSKLDEPLKPEVCESVLQGIAAIGVSLSGGHRSLAMAHVLYPLVGRIDSPDPGIRGVAAELLLGEAHREEAALSDVRPNRQAHCIHATRCQKEHMCAGGWVALQVMHCHNQHSA